MLATTRVLRLMFRWAGTTSWKPQVKPPPPAQTPDRGKGERFPRYDLHPHRQGLQEFEVGPSFALSKQLSTLQPQREGFGHAAPSQDLINIPKINAYTPFPSSVRHSAQPPESENLSGPLPESQNLNLPSASPAASNKRHIRFPPSTARPSLDWPQPEPLIKPLRARHINAPSPAAPIEVSNCTNETSRLPEPQPP